MDHDPGSSFHYSRAQPISRNRGGGLLLDRAGGDGRAVRAVLLPYVVEGLLAALLYLVDTHSEEGRRQLAAYRVSRFTLLLSLGFALSQLPLVPSPSLLFSLSFYRVNEGTAVLLCTPDLRRTYPLLLLHAKPQPMRIQFRFLYPLERHFTLSRVARVHAYSK